MSVIIFPRAHAGERQPRAFVLHVPHLVDTRRPLVLAGLDVEAMVAVEAKVDELAAAYAEAQGIADQLAALLKPFVAEGTL